MLVVVMSLSGRHRLVTATMTLVVCLLFFCLFDPPLPRFSAADADTERAVDPDSGWRGRAERITLLRAKVKNLEGALRTGRGGGGVGM